MVFELFSKRNFFWLVTFNNIIFYVRSEKKRFFSSHFSYCICALRLLRARISRPLLTEKTRMKRPPDGGQGLPLQWLHPESDQGLCYCTAIKISSFDFTQRILFPFLSRRHAAFYNHDLALAKRLAFDIIVVSN